ncbi:MAG: type I methionyl aminopeptidase [Oscillospiraceae bacterium]|nr:type I methionyl aminopeptidase [Oscillospiraceae bacterium]
MIKIRSAREIEIMRRAGKIAAGALKTAGEMIVPGISTKKLDTHIRKYIESRGASPSFYGYRGFPANSCISVNSEVIHGVPSESKILKDGDIVKIDVGAFFNGYHGDCANTFYCGNRAGISPEIKKLIEAAEGCFKAGVEYAQAGNRVGDIGIAVQKYIEGTGFSVVREYVGHCIGRELHENPEIPNFFSPEDGKGQRLIAGMVIAVEPMVNAGGYEVKVGEDEKTVITADGSLSAHYEHTVLILKNGYELLTLA